MSDAKTVLVVDDEPDAITIAESVLTEIEGVKVITAPNGKTGLARAREDHPDLMVLDVQMPDMTGFQVFSELAKDEATRSIPVVMLTGVEEKTGVGFSAGDMEEFLGAPPAGYLEKPVDPLQLQETVSRLLGITGA